MTVWNHDMPYFVFIEVSLGAKNMYVIYLLFFLIMLIGRFIFNSFAFLQIEKFLNYKLCLKAKLYLVSP